jgi:hypothetical protein
VELGYLFKGSRQFQDRPSGMTNNHSGCLIQLPPHCRYGAGAIPGKHYEVFHQQKEVIGQDSNPEEDRIGICLPARHPFHPESAHQFLDVVLCLTSLVVNVYHFPGTLGPIGRYDTIV